MTVSENPAKRSFVWPTDYYSSPTPAPVLPQWATFGCGAAAVVVLVIVFAGGAFLRTGGLRTFMGFVISSSVSEMRPMYATDVQEAQKKSLSASVDAMLKSLREEKISPASVQPFLEQYRVITADRKVTAKEAAALEAVAKRIVVTANNRRAL